MTAPATTDTVALREARAYEWNPHCEFRGGKPPQSCRAPDGCHCAEINNGTIRDAQLRAERDAAQARIAELEEQLRATKADRDRINDKLGELVVAVCDDLPPVETAMAEAVAATTRAYRAEAALASARETIAGVTAVLTTIAKLSPEPDDKVWRDNWNDPSAYRWIGADGAVRETTSVDTSNQGDVELFGYERGLHSAALIARAALSPEGGRDAKP